MERSLYEYLIFGSLSVIVFYTASITFEIASERQINRIRNKLFYSLIHQDIAFFDKNTTGELNVKITR